MHLKAHSNENLFSGDIQVIRITAMTLIIKMKTPARNTEGTIIIVR